MTIESFDPWMLKYLANHVDEWYFDPETPPEKTSWWKGDEFLKLMFPAEGWRLADDRLLLVNYWEDPIWLGLPSREVKRPPKDAGSWVPVSGLRFYGRGDLTEAQARRRCSAALKAWGLPVPSRQHFITAIRPILQKQHARIVAEEKREMAKWERDHAAWLRAEQRKEQEAARLRETPEAIALAAQLKAEGEARLAAWQEKRRLEDEEFARMGKTRLPKY
jgi:hypothetical protein